jgi:hypothetical protein
MKRGRESFAPDTSNHHVYELMNKNVYREIHDATDPILEQSFTIFH